MFDGLLNSNFTLVIFLVLVLILCCCHGDEREAI